MALPYSTVSYTGNGVTTDFAVPFPYFAQADIHVQVNGVDNTTFTWTNSTTVHITPAPGNGATVFLYRTTALGTASVTFADGSTLRAADLNSEFNQVLYGIQEAWDQTTAAINADRVQAGVLPVVTAPDNGKVLQVSAGVWTAVALGLFVATLPHDTSLTHASSQLAVNLATNSGLGISSGLKIVPSDNSLVLSGSGVAVQCGTGGGLYNAAGGVAIKGFQQLSADGSPAEGDVWYNTTAKSHRMQSAGSLTGGVVECVFRQTADSNAVVNTTTQTIFNQAFTIPANFLTVGKTLRVRFGVAFTTNSVNTTAGIACWLNGLAGTNFGGVLTSTFTNPAGRFEYELYLTCRSTGSGGTVHVSFHALGQDQAYGYALGGDDVVTYAINTTVSNTLSLSFQWGAANASNSGTQREMTVEVLNP